MLAGWRTGLRPRHSIGGAVLRLLNFSMNKQLFVESNGLYRPDSTLRHRTEIDRASQPATHDRMVREPLLLLLVEVEVEVEKRTDPNWGLNFRVNLYRYLIRPVAAIIRYGSLGPLQYNALVHVDSDDDGGGGSTKVNYRETMYNL